MTSGASDRTSVKNPSATVSAIIPCRNEAQGILACLATVLEQFEGVEHGWEVLVVDGMSEDGTDEILGKIGRENARVRLIPNPGRIVSAGLNAGIRAAKGEFIVRMDAHTEYAPDYVRRCLEALEHTHADNVGGPARTKADTYLGQAIAAAYHSPFSVGGARFHDVDYEGWVDTVTYGCWRREAFDRFGYFDEELVRNQDDEHNLRIVRAGGKIWQSPQIKSWYRPRSSLRALFNQYLQYGYWKVRVIQKHKIPASWRHLVPGLFVLGLAALFLLSAFCFLLSRLTAGSGLLTTDLYLLSSGLLALALSAYGSAVLAASVITAAKTRWKLFWVLPLVFPCYHFGYGYGFLHGLWDFIIRRRGAQKSFEALTR